MKNEISQNRLMRYAFSKVTVIVLFALLLSALLISVANDMYAFVKADAKVSVEIEAPTSVGDISALLAKEGVLKNPHVFSMYVRSKGRQDQLSSFLGKVELNSSMSYREILAEFTKTNNF